MIMGSGFKLPPIDATEDEKMYDALSETIDVSKASKCDHEEVKFHGNELRCKCGAVWVGPNIEEVYNFFKNRKKV